MKNLTSVKVSLEFNPGRAIHMTFRFNTKLGDLPSLNGDGAVAFTNREGGWISAKDTQKIEARLREAEKLIRSILHPDVLHVPPRWQDKASADDPACNNAENQV